MCSTGSQWRMIIHEHGEMLALSLMLINGHQQAMRNTTIENNVDDANEERPRTTSAQFVQEILVDVGYFSTRVRVWYYDFDPLDLLLGPVSKSIRPELQMNYDLYPSPESP